MRMVSTMLYIILGRRCLAGGLSAGDNFAQHGARVLTQTYATELPEAPSSMSEAVLTQPFASQSFMAPYDSLYDRQHLPQPIADQRYRPLYEAQPSAQALAEQPQPVVSLLAHGQGQPLAAQPWVEQNPENFASYARGSQAAALLSQDAAALSESFPSTARVSQLAALLSQDASALSYQLRVLEGDQDFTAFRDGGVQQDALTSLLQYAAAGTPNVAPNAELPHPQPQYEQHRLMQQVQNRHQPQQRQPYMHENWADSRVPTTRGPRGVYLGTRRHGFPTTDRANQFLA